MSEDEIRKITTETILKGISGYAKKKPKPCFQVLDLLIPEERKIRSIVGGLEGSLGKTLWEPLAKKLAIQNGFEIIHDDLLCPTHIPSELDNTLKGIISDRKLDKPRNNAKQSHEKIKDVCQRFIDNPITSFTKPPRGRGVDIWLRKGNTDYLFDTKTVQPNMSAFSSFLEQVLSWYAYFYSRYPERNAEARIIFPYNPHPKKSFWDGATGGGKPLESTQEAWVEDEFWDFCSGESNTFEIIKTSFTELRDTAELKSALDMMFKKLN